MKVTDLIECNIFENFISEANKTDNAILIDGKWGCGKTYVFDSFLKEKKNKKKTNKETQKEEDKTAEEYKKDKKDIKRIKYVSLYGVSNIADVDNKVRYALRNKILRWILSAFGVFSRVAGSASPVDISTDICEVINNVLEEANKSSRRGKNKVFVFDDLERVEKDFSYISLLGYFNTLFSAGAKVICLCSKDNIENIDTTKDFDEFTEKTFDRIYHIDETSVDIIYMMYDGLEREENIKYTKSDLNEIIPIYDENLRMVQKSINLIRNVHKYFIDNKIDYESLFSNSLLIEACSCAICIIYWNKKDFEKKPRLAKTDGGKSLHKNEIEFSDSVKTLDEAMNEKTVFFFERYEVKNSRNNVDFYSLVGCLIHFHLEYDSEYLLNYIESKKPRDDSLYNLICLSTDDNIEFSKKYINDIINNSNPIKVKEDLSDLGFLFGNTFYAISDTEKDSLTNAVVTYMNKSEENRQNVLKQNSYKFNTSWKKYYEIIEAAIGRFDREQLESHLKKIIKSYNSKHYKKLKEELELCFSSGMLNANERMTILDSIKNYNYFVPKDLTKTISHYEWDVTNLIARYIYYSDNQDFINDYIAFLRNIKSGLNDPSALTKINSLLSLFGVS